MRPLLHVSGIGIKANLTLDYNRSGNELSWKAGESVHKNVGRAKTAGGWWLQGKKSERAFLLENAFVYRGYQGTLIPASVIRFFSRVLPYDKHPQLNHLFQAKSD